MPAPQPTRIELAQWRAAAARWWKKTLVLAVVIGAFGTLSYLFGDRITLESLARHEAAFRDFHARRPVTTYATALAVYVVVTALSLPLATVLTLFYAWLFGMGRAVLVVSFASTAGATLAFLLSRYLLRGAVRRWYGARSEKFDAALAREGAFYLLTLRLLPVVPFFVINLVMGLTPIRVWTFWWCTQLGTLPATCVYAYAGSTFPTLAELADAGPRELLDWQLFAALTLLALLPLIVRWVLSRFRPLPAEARRQP
ncbi:MAG: TVP38/TMEM64 family protein [Planctomycetales bacterium]